MTILNPENHAVVDQGTGDGLPVIVVGAGGHARVLIEMLRRTGTEIIGLVDPAHRKGVFINRVPVIGNDKVIDSYSNDEVRLVNGIGPISGQDKRASIAKRFRSKGFRFKSIIDPHTCIATDVKLSEGVQVMPGVVIQPGVEIGLDSILNTGVNLDHDCQIGSNVHIAPGSTLCGNVIVGDDVNIGSGTIVIQAVEIGEKSIIGAGSVVFVDIKAGLKLIQHRVNRISVI